MSVYQSEMKIPIRPAPPPPVNASAPQKVSKPLTAWNGAARVNHTKVPTSVQKKKPPPRPPPPKFNQKQDKKHIPARPSQLITSLFHKKNNNSSKIGDPVLKPAPEIVENKGNNVLSLIDFNSPPSSPTFTTRSSSDALSVNSFGSDGVTPCSTSSGNTSNVESGFEDDFDFFLGSAAKKPDNQVKDPWSLSSQDQRQKNPSPLLMQNQKLNSKNNSWVAFSSTSTTKKNEFSAMPTIIRVKPERPKLPDKVTNSVSTSNVNVLAEIFENSHQTQVNTGGSLFQEEDDDNDDGWSSESPPMPTCPPPAPPLEVLQSLLESSPEVLGVSNEKAHGIALYDYEGDHPDDLSFKENDVINLVRRMDKNWFLGELNGREGTVPANYLSVRVPLPDDADRHVTALYAFRPETWDDLEFQEGAVINVISRIDQDWLYGECNGRTGQFPANFVDRVPANLPTDTCLRY
ncbi:UNVERIFIED_CONTAM: hypothetical protein PYX00_003722 [Menopon gallinae]|uniref:SH3 domain-containing protein n=1 Tax=Menopon gallinae TaxID=328185 RepID=A0AAW2I1J2_9NEOP